jgi:hypothetical protein
MRFFTLRTFLSAAPEGLRQHADLVLIDEIRFPGRTAQEGKSRLSELIVSGGLPPERFYRFEGSDDFPEVRPSFHFDISFYLFAGGSICPVRVARLAAGTGWTVDFNGIPGWSLIAAIEPRWYSLDHELQRKTWTLPRNNWTGASQRDWWERRRWSVEPPRNEAPLLPATATLG